MSKWIKNGIAVVNITNLDKVMTVEKVVYKTKRVSKDEQSTTISRIVGIECKTIDSEGNPIRSMHHSKELIPLSVVQKGKLEAYKFVNKEGDYENY